MKIDDSILYREIFSPTCSRCRHLKISPVAGIVECLAFRSIPKEIWSGNNPHTESYPGDNGIIFSPIQEKGRV